MVLAFFPKVTALLIAIPPPVATAYITFLLGLLFVQGMKIIIQDGVDHRKAAVAGLASWIGVGFQNQWIFPDLLGEGFLSVLLGNGMTSGALVAVIMMVFMELTGPRRRRLNVVLDAEALLKLSKFLREFASRARWGLRFDGPYAPDGRGNPEPAYCRMKAASWKRTHTAAWLWPPGQSVAVRSWSLCRLRKGRTWRTGSRISEKLRT